MAKMCFGSGTPTQEEKRGLISWAHPGNESSFLLPGEKNESLSFTSQQTARSLIPFMSDA